MAAAAFISLFQPVDKNYHPADIKYNEDHITNTSALETAAGDASRPDGSKDVIVDSIAVFGAIFVAAIAIVFISIYVSKVRKRPIAGQAEEQQPQPSAPETIDQTFNEDKSSMFRKTVRSVILRLRGQQHKDVCVLSPQLRAQLKEIYVY